MEQFAGRILVVDDDRFMLKVITSILRGSDFDVFASEQPVDALKEITSIDPDLVITDLNMPRMDGFELCRRIHEIERFHEIPILFYSSATDEKTIVQGFAAGGVDFVSKPARYDEVLARVRTHIELSQSKQRIVRSEKMAAVGQLAAGVAHEINNPLAYVLSNLRHIERYQKSMFEALTAFQNLAEDAASERLSVEIVQQRVQSLRSIYDLELSETESTEMLYEMDDGLNRIVGIVRDLRDFSHPSNMTKKAVDMNDEVNRAVRLTNNSLKYVKDVQLDLSEVPPVQAVPSQLSQVFTAILVNAAHAVSARPDSRIEIKTAEHKGSVVVAIRDNGPGIDPHVKSKIFDPFFTTKDIGKGTGLGLSIAMGIIRDHGGTIDVDSVPDSGAVFRIRLPVNGR